MFTPQIFIPSAGSGVPSVSGALSLCTVNVSLIVIITTDSRVTFLMVFLLFLNVEECVKVVKSQKAFSISFNLHKHERNYHPSTCMM